MSMSTFLSGLEASNWLKHIKAVLDTSLFIAKAIIRERASVLVHCSDGWDRTAQTCSLASIILDPYYRTIHGFQVQYFVMGSLCTICKKKDHPSSLKV